MASFADQVAAFAEKAKSQQDAIVRGCIVEVGARVIARSPKDTGRFKSNWRYGLETRDAFTTKATDIRTLNNIEELPKAAAGFVHFVSNALPYGPALERGHSKQAPQGMVALTALEWSQIVEQVALKVSSQSYVASAVPYA
jgi:hypothetical protein